MADPQRVLGGTKLFPPDILPEMLQASKAADAPEVWLTADDDGQAVAFCYAAPEQLTEGTWNMRAIAVLPEHQGQSIGAKLTQALENRLRDDGHRILIADTSGTEDFAQIREFYRKRGYTEESRIRDFWSAGDDKVTFRKAL